MKTFPFPLLVPPRSLCLFGEFFLLKSFSEASVTTGFSILGTTCSEGECNNVNAATMGIIVILLVLFQYLFYHRYHTKRRTILKKVK